MDTSRGTRFVCIGAFISTLCRRVSPHRRSRIRTACVTSYFCGRTEHTRTHAHTRSHSHSVPPYLCYGDSGLCLTLIFCFPSKYGTPLRLNREFPFKRGPRERNTVTLDQNNIRIYLVFHSDNFRNKWWYTHYDKNYLEIDPPFTSWNLFQGFFYRFQSILKLQFFFFFLLQYAGIRIGPVVKKDVMKASIMLEHDSQWVDNRFF